MRSGIAAVWGAGGVCLQGRGGGGRADAAEARRLGDPELGVELVLAVGELAGWVKSPSFERKWPWRIWPSSARIVRQVSHHHPRL